MPEVELAKRCFTMEDQLRFAALSGDVNPMHIDAVAARRTQAGSPVVHGINALLWALDQWSSQTPDADMSSLSVRFERFVPLDSEVSLTVVRSGAVTKLKLRADGSQRMSVKLDGATPEIRLAPCGHSASAAPPHVPVVLDFDEASRCEGVMALKDCGTAFPYLARMIGAPKVAAIIGLSTLVGMVVPGLHSIFSTAELMIDDAAPEPADILQYRVVGSHRIYRLIEVQVAGPGVRGLVKAFVRPPPAEQPALADLRRLVKADAFADVSALVVGGSRGLGELTAKLLAAGGARVVITYAVGQEDAAAVAAEIQGQGGDCSVFRLDVRQPIAEQLKQTGLRPNQLYYFATPKIFLQGSKLYDAAAFAHFQRVYVDAFAELCEAMVADDPGSLTIFYPSSIAVEDRPRAMTEYAMAKTAGEIVCVDLDRFLPGLNIVMRRLPRLHTDQTATITPVETIDSTETMLAVVTDMVERMRASETDTAEVA